MTEPLAKILVVDDIPANRLLAGKILAGEFEVDSVKSGEEALDFFTRKIPDLVLLDIYMEGTLAVLSPEANIRVGGQILSDCIRRRGSIEGGLACYVGATGPSDGGYGAKVLAERRRIALASGIPIRAR